MTHDKTIKELNSGR